MFLRPSLFYAIIAFLVITFGIIIQKPQFAYNQNEMRKFGAGSDESICPVPLPGLIVALMIIIGWNMIDRT